MPARDPVETHAGVVSEAGPQRDARRHPPARRHARRHAGPPGRRRRCWTWWNGCAGSRGAARRTAAAAHADELAAAAAHGSTCRRRCCWPAPSPRSSSWPTSPSSSTARGSYRAPASRRRPAAAARRAAATPTPTANGCCACWRRTELRPVFTAHPTEASRQSVLRTLRRVADLLGRPRLPTTDAADRRLAELVDLLWLTDELRPGKPTPVDEARAVTYYLDQLSRTVLPELLDDLDAQLRGAGIEPPPDLRPDPARLLGRRRPGRQPQRLAGGHHGRAAALRRPRDALPDRRRRRADRGAGGLHPGRRDRRSSKQSLGRDREALPEVHDRYIRLNAEEPYRLKCSYIRARLQNTHDRIAAGHPHRAGAATTSAPTGTSTSSS